MGMVFGFYCLCMGIWYSSMDVGMIWCMVILGCTYSVEVFCALVVWCMGMGIEIWYV